MDKQPSNQMKMPTTLGEPKELMMIFTMFFILSQTFVPEAQNGYENFSMSITAFESDDTIEVALQLRGGNKQALVVRDQAGEVDLYIAATQNIGGALRLLSGFEKNAQYEETPDDVLDGAFSFSLSKAALPEADLTFSLSDLYGRSFEFCLRGLLTNLNETTTIGVGSLPEALNGKQSFTPCYDSDKPACGSGSDARKMWVYNAQCGSTCIWCCISRTKPIYGACINLNTCRVVCPPCVQSYE